MNPFISRHGSDRALRVRRMALMGSALAALAGASVGLAQRPPRPGATSRLRRNQRCSRRPSML